MIDGVCDFNVQNVQIYRGYVLHSGYMKYGALSVGNNVLAEYDEVRIIYRNSKMEANQD